jgi:DNA mismatch endonuclease (patch repair protein)
MMSGIRNKNTKPEITTRKALHRLGYRYSLKTKIDKIKPDVVLPRWNIAVFVHGCYWHQHAGCKLAYSDRNYSQKWKRKFANNKARDQRTRTKLKDKGWRVAEIWECCTRDENKFEETMKQLDIWIKSGKSLYFESRYRKV